MSCETACYELQISCCESPKINAGLTAGDIIHVILTRPGSKKIYKREVIVDNDGAITIDKNYLPAAFFGYGYIEIQLMKGANFDTIQPFTFNNQQYDCVLLELIDIDE